MLVQVPKGTNDILPAQIDYWYYLENIIKEVLQNFGYREIRTPVFEYTELFVRGIGETTDIVAKEMFTFSDKKGRSLTLRPEGTAPVIRAYLEHNLSRENPLTKLFYIESMFRVRNRRQADSDSSINSVPKLLVHLYRSLMQR